jgi:hypothetical protein
MMGRRSTLISLGVGLVAALLAACGGDDNDAGPDTTGTDVTSTTGASGGDGDGDDVIDSVIWGPDSPPIPDEYRAWAPSDSGQLQCDLSDQAPEHPFWELAGQICRVFTGEGDWPSIDSVPDPAPSLSPYHACLDGELKALLERALTWHADHPGESPVVALPAAGTHSPCQRSLYDVGATIDTDSPTCDEIPRPRIAITMIAPGQSVDDEPPATVRGEGSCVPQDSEDDGNGFRRLVVVVEGRSEAREVTIDVESDYGTLTTTVRLPEVPDGDGGGSTTTEGEPSTTTTQPSDTTVSTTTTDDSS